MCYGSSSENATSWFDLCTKYLTLSIKICKNRVYKAKLIKSKRIMQKLLFYKFISTENKTAFDEK